MVHVKNIHSSYVHVAAINLRKQTDVIMYLGVVGAILVCHILIITYNNIVIEGFLKIDWRAGVYSWPFLYVCPWHCHIP